MCLLATTCFEQMSSNNANHKWTSRIIQHFSYKKHRDNGKLIPNSQFKTSECVQFVVFFSTLVQIDGAHFLLGYPSDSEVTLENMVK